MMTNHDLFLICDCVAEAQTILHDHLECGKHSPAEVLTRLQRVLSEEALLRALHDVGYFPRATPPVSRLSGS
jgi:hypothetical protein